MPPNEKRGRRHSSEVVVIILDAAQEPNFVLDMSDVRVEVARGKGPGGQHRNVTESTVRAVHLPTGISATADGRSQIQNRDQALRVLTARLAERASAEAHGQRNQTKAQAYDHGRSYTWTTWRDEVQGLDGRRASMKQALKGRLDPLLK